MIKLIATDMDGTLLKDDKSINPEIFDIIEKLHEKGIVFVVASGRQYPGLERFFRRVKDKIFFIAENGTYVMYKDEEIYSSIMDKAVVKDVLKEIRKIPDIKPIIGCKEYSYTEDEYIFEFMGGAKFDYTMRLIDRVEDVEDEILKVAIMDKGDVYSNSFDFVYPKFKESLEVAVSGHNFIDFTNKGVNKGLAMKKIQQKLGITVDQSMAFGDNYNDVKMLEQVGFSFAVANANDGVKKKAKFIAPSNNDDGVIKTIIKYCF